MPVGRPEGGPTAAFLVSKGHWQLAGWMLVHSVAAVVAGWLWAHARLRSLKLALLIITRYIANAVS